MQTGRCFKIGLIVSIFCLLVLTITVGSTEASPEYIDIEISVVDLENKPVSNAWVIIWDKEMKSKIGGSGATGDDGKVSLKVGGGEDYYIIQVTSFETGKQLALETRYLSPSLVKVNQTIIANEVVGESADIKMYQIANGSLNIARKSLDIATWSFWIAIASLVSTLLISKGSYIVQKIKNFKNRIF